MRPPLAALFVAALLVTGGCLGFVGESRPASDQRALDTLNRTQAAVANVTSYRASSNGTAEMSNEDDRVAVAYGGSVLVNVTTRELNATGRVNESYYAPPVDRRTYVTGYTAYTECKLAGWGRRTLSESRPWVEYTPLGDQLAVFNRTPVYWQGTQRLNGTETAVIVARPTKAELDSSPGLWSPKPENPESATFRNATLSLWVSTETWRPVRTRWETNWRADGADVTLTATWRFGGYDAPANVSRPSFEESDVRTDGC